MIRLSEADIERFTCGDCHILAFALNKITGWPIYCFGIENDPDIHAFVVRPDGRALDVEGVHTIEALAEGYGIDSAPVKFTRKRLYELWGGPQFNQYSYTRARKIAPYLLELYNA